MHDVDRQFTLLVAPLAADRGLRVRNRLALSAAAGRRLVWIVVLALGALGASMMGHPHVTQELSKALRSPGLW